MAKNKQLSFHALPTHHIWCSETFSISQTQDGFEGKKIYWYHDSGKTAESIWQSFKQQTTQNVSNSGINGRLAAWSSKWVTWRGQHWLGSKCHSVSVLVAVVVEMMVAAVAVVWLWRNYFSSGTILPNFIFIYLFILGLMNYATHNFDHITSNYSVIMTKC